MKNKLSYAVDAIVQCYLGNHALYRRQSLVCNGGTVKWISKSTYLCQNFEIPHSSENENLLRSVLASQRGCRQLFLTKLSRTATLRRSKASIALVMSPLLLTLRVVLIVMLALQIMVRATPCAANVKAWVKPSQVKAQSSQDINKIMKLVKTILIKVLKY